MESAPQESNHRIMVALDGSEASHNAFEQVADNIYRHGDSLALAHVYNPSKGYLPLNMRPESIRSLYEAELLARFTKSDHTTMLWEQLPEGNTTKEKVATMVEEYKADLLAVGFNGRKKATSDPTVLGSAVIHLALNPVAPILIVKSLEKRANKKDGAFNWMVCIDGSERSLCAVKTAIRFMDIAKDKLHGVSVASGSHGTKEAAEHFKKMVDEAGVRGEFFHLEKDPVHTVE